jgi:hypothetical protein
MDFLSYLNQFEEGFRRAETKEPVDFDPLPDGKYKVRVDKAQLVENQYTGNPQLTWEFEIVEGKHASRKIWKYNQLDSQDRVNWLKQDFRNCGVLLASLSTLQQELVGLLDKVLIVNLKTNTSKNGKDYQNVYIVKEIAGNSRLDDSSFPF